MESEVNMSVSPIYRKDGAKKIYLVFTDGDKMAEILLPDPGSTVKVLKNKGFSEEEISKLVAYVENDRDNITAIAGRVTPLKAFLGQEQGP
ncbi:MAG: hypothetical protein IJ796_03180 [Lachnospiraceae bacterium]|nr:hypothetical protein [Lachnospiraceae bacterium]